MATLTKIAPVIAPYYLAIDFVDIDPWPDASAALDFSSATKAGRMIARSNDDGLGTIELHGIAGNTGRDLIYLDCTEPSGPGSAAVGVHAPLTVDNYLTCTVDDDDIPLLEIPVNLNCAEDATVGGLARAYGFGTPDLTQSNVAIGTGEDGNGTPVINFINAGAPADQKQWLIAALTDRMIFTATADDNADFYWMQALRTGHTVTEVDIFAALVHLSGNLTLNGDIEGDLTINGDLQANTADFAACNVNGSPVLTRAELPPDAIPYPPAGIAVSEEDAWGLSIDPASLATWPGAGIPVSTGSAWGVPINPATLATYPAAGIAVSTGSAWGAPIAAANVAMLNAANTFAQTQTFNNNITLAGGNGTLLGSGSLIVEASGGNGLYLNWTSGTLGIHFGDGAGNQVGIIDNAGNASFAAVHVASSTAGHNGVAIGTDFLIWDDGGTSFIDGGHGGQLKLNAQLIGGTVTVNGNFDVVSGSKNFVVPHPHVEGKELVHSCLEGPEIGVFYRGEVTTKEGQAEVVLPDYFESLTFEDDRSVLLAQIVESDGEALALLAATRVIDGRFSIRSSADVRVAWEVKAVRRIGVERLNIVRDKFVPKAQEEKPHEQRKPRRTAN